MRTKILVIRLSALGDTIHTLPAIYILRKKFSNAQIDWVVEDKASKFIINNPLLDNVYVINKKNRLEIINKIRKEKYDIALDFQQLFKSGVILGFSGAKRKIMLDGAREFSFIFANEIVKTNRKLFDINYHVVKRNIDLVKYLDYSGDEIKFVLPDFSNEYSEEIIEEIKQLDKTKKTIVLSPATTWKNKHWTLDGWQKIIKEFQNDCNIIITAGKNEKEIVSRILSDIENLNVKDLSGKTSLIDLVYIYKHADLVVSPDSGSANVAWSAGAKSILTLFFSTSAKRTAPFGDNYYSIQANIECSPCMKKKCRLKNCNCKNFINPYEVIKIIKEKII